MDIPNHAELLAKIEGFCRRHDLAETRFGRDAVNNPAFISGLRRSPPVSPTLDTLGKIRDYMDRLDRDANFSATPPAFELTAPEKAEEDVPLPFGRAPATGAGGSSSTSSTTPARRPSPGASGSCSATDRESAK